MRIKSTSTRTHTHRLFNVIVCVLRRRLVSLTRVCVYRIYLCGEKKKNRSCVLTAMYRNHIHELILSERAAFAFALSFSLTFWVRWGSYILSKALQTIQNTRVYAFLYVLGICLLMCHLEFVFFWQEINKKQIFIFIYQFYRCIGCANVHARVIACKCVL